MMVEPVTVGMLGHLLSPRTGIAVAISNGHSRPSRKDAQMSLATNFFTPVSRRQKLAVNKSISDVVLSTAIHNVLHCQSWASPPSKEWLWHHDGPMRRLLLQELEDAKASRLGARTRRMSKSIRIRLRSLTPRKELGTYFFQNSYSTSSKTQLKPLPSRMQATASQGQVDDDPVTSASTTTHMIQLEQFIEKLASQDLMENSAIWHEEIDQLATSGVFLSGPFGMVLHCAELLADQIDMMCAHRLNKSMIKLWGQQLLGLHSTLGKRAATTSSPEEDTRMEIIQYRAYALAHQLYLSQAYLSRINDPNAAALHAENQGFIQVLRSHTLAMGIYRGVGEIFDYLRGYQSTSAAMQAADNFSVLLNDNIFRQFLSNTPSQQIIRLKSLLASCRPPLQVALREKILSILDPMNAETQLSNTIIAGKELDPISLDPLYLPTGDIPLVDRPSPTVKDNLPEAPDVLFQQLERYSSHQDASPLPTTRNRMTLDKVKLYKPLFDRQFNLSDVNGMRDVIRTIINDGYTPLPYMFSNAIKICRSTGDSATIIDLLKTMRELGVEWPTSVYTTLILFFGTKMDSTTASSVYARAISNGVTPDIAMNNALLYAYGRQGSFNKALKLFRDMEESDSIASVHTYNLMIKIALICGCPLSTMTHIFSRLGEKLFEPDKMTFGAMIHACLMRNDPDTAQRLYMDMVEKEKTTGETWIDINVLTSLLSAFIRAGLKKDAADVVAEIGRRGLQPNAITYNAIIQSYGMTKSTKQIAVAEDLVAKLTANQSGWHDIKNQRQNPLALLYSPILVAYANRMDIDGAERTMGKYMDAGGKPTISLLTTLLTLYRNTRKIDKLLQTWSLIMNLAINQSKDFFGSGVKSQIARITVPLSVFTQGASAAGYHDEVRNTWLQLHEHGLHFDQPNWNDYVIANVRAGDVLTAFQAAEEYLVPFYRKDEANYMTVLSAVSRSQKPTREAFEDLEDAPDLDRVFITPQHINRVANMDEDLSRMVDTDAHSRLEVRRVLNPLWRDERARRHVLQALLTCMQHLQEGRPIHPIRISGDTRDSEVRDNRVDFNSSWEVLNEIQKSCPGILRQINTYQQYLYRTRQTGIDK